MDNNWINELYTKHSSHIYNYLYKHVNNKEDCEDMLQNIFMSCHQYKDKFDASRCDEKAWLFILAKNRLKNYYRDKKQVASLDDPDANLQVSDEDSVSQAMQLMSCRDSIADALNCLDERSRTVVVLRFFDGLSPTEIAETMGIDDGNIRVIQTRALKKMRNFLVENNYF